MFWLLSLESCLHFVQRDAESQEQVGIDQHLKLLSLAAHHDHLRDAGDREQPLSHDPVGERAELHWRGIVRRQSCRSS